MKTLKRVPVEVVEVEFIPEYGKMEFGKIYHSKRFDGCAHLCLCGCGVECYLPLKPDEWQLKMENGKVTITPSIQQRFACHSHYIITKGVANFV